MRHGECLRTICHVKEGVCKMKYIRKVEWWTDSGNESQKLTVLGEESQKTPAEGSKIKDKSELQS